MKALAEFETLEAAKEYPQTRGKMIHRNSMNAWLSGAGKYRRLKAIAADEAHPLGDGAAAFLDSTEYNLIQSSETGQGVIQLMQALIAAEGNDAGFQTVLDKAIAEANEVYYPYENVSEYEFKKARGEDIARKKVKAVDGYLDIQVTEDCEQHRPKVYAFVAKEYRFITTMEAISLAGKYSCMVPKGHTELFIDDCYGVIQPCHTS